MYKNLLLFDFDGVIADTFHMALNINRRYIEDLSEEEYRSFFEGNIYEIIKNKPHRLPSQEQHFEHYEKEVIDQQVFPGMKELLIELKKDFELIIVSSSPSNFIHKFLTRNGLDEVFSEILGSDVSFSKHEKVASILLRKARSPQQALFITDTLGDILEASQVNVKSIAVTWGFSLREVLLSGNPIALVDSANELEKQINLFFSVVY